jgi:RNA-directed DNA polymerase
MTTLQAAWQQVQSNKGSHGVDGMSVERFTLKQAHYLPELQQLLKEGSYQPLPVKRVVIPKAGVVDGHLEFRRLKTELYKPR